MAAVDRTTHAGVIPTVWEPIFEHTAQEPRGASKFFWDVSERVQGPGNVYKINILPKLTVAAGFAGGSDLKLWSVGGSVNKVTSLTPSTVTMNMSFKAVAIQIEPDIEDYSVTALADEYVPVLAEACGQGLDIDLFNQFGDFNASDNVGTATTNWTLPDFLLGLMRLRKNMKDKFQEGDDITSFYDLGQMDKIFASSDVVNAAVRGEKIGSAVDGRTRLIYGAQVKLTGNIASSSGRRNLIAAKKALVHGRKYAAKIETDRIDLITNVYAYMNWGVESVHSFTTYGSTGGKDLAVQHLTA